MAVLRIIVGLVLRGIFSQTLCWFKARCDAPLHQEHYIFTSSPHLR